MGLRKRLVKPVFANRGIELAYRKTLKQMIDVMTNSLEYWLLAQYKKTPPKIEKEVKAALMATDAKPPSQDMKLRLNEIAQRWMKKFEELAPKIAESYITRTFKSTDSAFMANLRDAGWSVKFKMTPAMKDALNASINENISLIKSIPAKYLQQVEGIVMRAYTIGIDEQAMVQQIKALYPHAAKRATLIARDQSNKANAVVNRARQLELGITKAIWMHSHAGKEPRQSHVNADGKEFDVATGKLIDGEYILPGQKINCRCTSRAVLPI